MSASSIEQTHAAAKLTDALAQTGQPQVVFEVFERLIQDTIGHRLFTILGWRPESGDVERLHTSRPAEYPLLGRKRMGPTPWGTVVLEGGQAWFGANRDAIRWAFPDSDLILSLGCESCLNAPIRYDGRVLGVISVLDRQERYSEHDLETLVPLSAFLIPPLLLLDR